MLFSEKKMSPQNPHGDIDSTTVTSSLAHINRDTGHRHTENGPRQVTAERSGTKYNNSDTDNVPWYNFPSSPSNYSHHFKGVNDTSRNTTFDKHSEDNMSPLYMNFTNISTHLNDISKPSQSTNYNLGENSTVNIPTDSYSSKPAFLETRSRHTTKHSSNHKDFIIGDSEHNKQTPRHDHSSSGDSTRNKQTSKHEHSSSGDSSRNSRSSLFNYNSVSNHGNKPKPLNRVPPLELHKLEEVGNDLPQVNRNNYIDVHKNTSLSPRATENGLRVLPLTTDDRNGQSYSNINTGT